MPSYTAGIDIDLPPEQVFAYVSDLLRHGDWTGDKVTIERSDGGSEVAVGAQYRSRNQLIGTANLDAIEVTQYGPPWRFTFDVVSRAGLFRNAFELSPSSTGTRLTKMLVPVKPKGLALVLRPIFPLVIPRSLSGDLRRIKARLEA